MSDLIKAQATPQFNWYNRWTSLGPDGMPDKLIEEGMKQPDRIKTYLRERNEGYHRTHRARPGTIWTRVLSRVHASGLQVEDLNLTL
jgi:hypothetical protein